MVVKCLSCIDLKIVSRAATLKSALQFLFHVLAVRSRVPAQLNAIFGSRLSQPDCRSLKECRLIDRVSNGQPRIAPASTFLYRSSSENLIVSDDQLDGGTIRVDTF